MAVGPSWPKLTDPRILALVARSRCLLVADNDISRVVVVDPTLNKARAIPLRLHGHEKSDGEIVEPQARCLDSEQ